jgi:rhamnogalacturonan hydrolase
LDGAITVAFITTLAGTMIQWNDCTSITLTGTGSINGQGTLWRPDNNLSTYPSRPRLFRFQNCNNCIMNGITMINSPMFHMTVIGNNNELYDLTVTADIIGETDGFDMSGNGNYVHDVTVTIGDECVTVKSPTNGFIAENIVCYYTAGCNIGSFGSDGTGAVENVYYANVAMYNSDAGAQIKTYPNNVGYVKNIYYYNFTLTAVAYPMAINLYWASAPVANGTLTISNVTFNTIRGTQDVSNARPAVDIQCVPGYECTDITFINDEITTTTGVAIYSTLDNVCGTGWTGLDAC